MKRHRALLCWTPYRKFYPTTPMSRSFVSEDNKLRLSGVTKDAPSLISLIEQSGRFTRATFSAPTTQSPSEP